MLNLLRYQGRDLGGHPDGGRDSHAEGAGDAAEGNWQVSEESRVTSKLCGKKSSRGFPVARRIPTN